MNIDTATLREAGWREGMEMDDEELYALKQASDSRRAKEKALYLLEHRSHTKKELVEKIQRTAGEKAAVEAAERMEELGLLNDEEYARRYAWELFHRKGYAAKRVVYELKQKGISEEVAADLVEELAPEPVEKLKELLGKKYGRVLGEEPGRRRAVNAMQRLGYPYEQIRKALLEVIPEIQDEDEEYNGI